MKHTKLQELVAETLGVAPDSQEVTDTIEVFAGWFELVLEDIGLEPASIPSLLRWQYVGPKTVDEYGYPLKLGDFYAS
jgi:hypothetical protein